MRLEGVMVVVVGRLDMVEFVDLDLITWNESLC